MPESFRARREALGLTLQQLADAASLNLRAVQKYEAGICEIGNMSLKNALRICKALQCSPEELLSLSQGNKERAKKGLNIVSHFESKGYSLEKRRSDVYSHDYTHLILPGGIDIQLTTTTTNKAGGEGLTDVYDRQTVEAVEDFITVVKDASAFLWRPDPATDATENYIRETDARSIAEHANPDYQLLIK